MANNLPLLSQLDFFESKIARLVVEVQVARARVLELEQENAVLSEKNSEHLQLIKQLQKKAEKEATVSPSFSKSTNFVKIVNNNRNDTETIAELKQKLTVYIDELDRCITYLGNLS
ncbi:hypothetical protein [Tellurirhabdus bombi]|uniref:hypothetical protein n=1 Tax=Tellurirhabdus bombi TaxID=2907205 RepID=UPI001F2ACD00|nr:hypothetical protein [Tellurirhabdus bombi]